MADKADRDGFTPEQHLVAAVAEYKNLETANRSYLERMIQSLTSPFKISAKPCEQQRLNVLQCYDRVLKTSVGESADDGPQNRVSGSSGAATGARQDVSEIPIHHCYPDVVAYHKCVKEDTLSQHLALTARFEEQRLAALSNER